MDEFDCAGLKHDFVYDAILKSCDGQLEIHRAFDSLVGWQMSARWTGGNRIILSGELLRDLDYDREDVLFDPPFLLLYGYQMRWVEWHEPYDMAVFERIVIKPEPLKWFGPGYSPYDT